MGRGRGEGEEPVGRHGARVFRNPQVHRPEPAAMPAQAADETEESAEPTEGEGGGGW